MTPIPFPSRNYGISRVQERPATVTKLSNLWSFTYLDANNSYGICTVIANDIRGARWAFRQAHPDYREILSETRR